MAKLCYIIYIDVFPAKSLDISSLRDLRAWQVRAFFHIVRFQQSGEHSDEGGLGQDGIPGKKKLGVSINGGTPKWMVYNVYNGKYH